MASQPPSPAPESFKSGPWTDLGLTLPIFVGYHLGVVFLPVRNAADVVTRELVVLANDSLLLYGALTLAIGAAYVGTLAVLGRGRALRWDRFATVALEGIVYAVAMRLAAIYVVGELFSSPELRSGNEAGGVSAAVRLSELSSAASQAVSLSDGSLAARFAGLVMSFGAGFYEEIAFRVVAYGLGARLMLVLLPPFPLRKALTYAGWAVVMALVFSGWHYVGAYGDPFDARSFVFRAVCGLIFTIIYHLRGFAPAVWTHALYDTWVLVL